MLADLYVNGVFAALQDECLDTVSLEFDRASAYRCRSCGEDLIETVNGLCTDSDEYECPDHDPGPSSDSDPDAESVTGPHDPERVPLSWYNSAAVSTNEDEDSVTVSISVGDPRGAFTFTIRRCPMT